MSLKTRKSYHFLCLMLAFLALLAGANSVFGQTPPPETPKPKSNAKPEKPQTTEKTETPFGRNFKVSKKSPAVFDFNYDTSEKAIIVDPKINISLCVQGGNIKVNGWDRNEVRVFINQGSPIGFKVLQKNRQTEKPVWVMIVGFDPKKNTVQTEECISGDDIEIDAPRNATVNIKSQESKTVIDSIGKVSIKNVVGDIMLNNIANGVKALTLEGDVIVEKSNGAMDLQSITGNISVSGVSPSEIGDVFKAKTNNGAISLQAIEHRQMEINTNSGSIKFTGELSTNGQYSFNTQNGSILLFIPPDSSCKINAVYGYGTFNSEIPLQKVEKNPSPQIKSLTAQIGNGDAALNFTTYNGSINIKKQ
ncbi:MAG: DUF4097 family beta strand repeat-containing protein [Pyrinomonadaceae bacterium]